MSPFRPSKAVEIHIQLIHPATILILMPQIKCKCVVESPLHKPYNIYLLSLAASSECTDDLTFDGGSWNSKPTCLCDKTRPPSSLCVCECCMCVLCVIRIYLYFIGRYQQFMSCAIRNPPVRPMDEEAQFARDITMKEYTSPSKTTRSYNKCAQVDRERPSPHQIAKTTHV